MKDGERRRAFVEAVTTGRDVADLIGKGNYARLVSAQPGISAAVYDSDLVAHTSSSDPTGMAVIRRPDQSVHDVNNLDRALAAWVLAGDTVRRILSNYGPPRAAGEADRLALLKDNTRPAPHCESCARINEPHGDTPQLIDPWPGRGPTDVKGRLPQPMLLCRWCYSFTADQGVLPTEKQLLARRDGLRVRVADNTPRRSA